MENEVAIVIPYYRNELTVTERISLDRCRKLLGRYHFCFVSPLSLTIDEENLCSGDEVIYVADEWMNGIEAYNQMMLMAEFYHKFEKYKYILLYQLDAYVFSDRLMEFCLLGYDYVGAPWIDGLFDIDHTENGVVYVGNGGFSLRKVRSCIDILDKHEGKVTGYVEDAFWASQNSEQFKVAPVDVALDFSFERPVKVLFERNNGRLPFGCHAWMKYDFDFFRPYLVADGYEILQEYSSPYEYDKSLKYRDQRFMLADEECILKAIDKLTKIRPKVIYIYGAGRNGKKCGYLLSRLNSTKVIYLDRNELIWGKDIYNFPIMSPDVIKSDECAIVIMTVSKYESVLTKLADKKFLINKNVILLNSFFDMICALMQKTDNCCGVADGGYHV